jgi:hypothetical protein
MPLWDNTSATMAQRATNEMIQLLFFIYASLKTILIFGSQQNEGKKQTPFW